MSTKEKKIETNPSIQCGEIRMKVLGSYKLCIGVYGSSTYYVMSLCV